MRSRHRNTCFTRIQTNKIIHTNTLIWVPLERAKMGMGNGKMENWPSVPEVQRQTNNKQGKPLGLQALEERVQWASF